MSILASIGQAAKWASRMHQDPLNQRFLAAGHRIEPFRIGRNSAAIGQQIVKDTCEIAYRTEQRDVIIILLRRISPLPGIRHPFRELHWFLAQVCALRRHYRRVRGLVKPQDPGDLRGIAAHRLADYYRRHLNSASYQDPFGDLWFYHDLDDDWCARWRDCDRGGTLDGP